MSQSAELLGPEELVLSDAHISCPSGQHHCTTTYEYSMPAQASASTAERARQSGASSAVAELQTDSDGDLLVCRRRPQDPQTSGTQQLVIHHHLATPLQDVGLQVWRGALLLADFILSRPAKFAGVTALELGAGPGLAGLALATLARRVYLTDLGEGVLHNCQLNVDANCHNFRHGGSVAQVRQLDWTEGWPPPTSRLQNGSSTAYPPDSITRRGPYNWTAEDMKALEGLQVVLAADTVYDADLTEAFVSVTHQLLRASRHGAAAYVALEKRFNFTLRDMDARAHAFEYFQYLVKTYSSDSATSAVLVAERVEPSSIPQVSAYERSADLELWKIKLARPQPGH